MWICRIWCNFKAKILKIKVMIKVTIHVSQILTIWEHTCTLNTFLIFLDNWKERFPKFHMTKISLIAVNTSIFILFPIMHNYHATYIKHYDNVRNSVHFQDLTLSTDLRVQNGQSIYPHPPPPILELDGVMEQHSEQWHHHVHVLTLECNMASVSIHTLHPPYSNLMAWWSSIRNSDITMSVIFCSSSLRGYMYAKENSQSCHTDICNRVLK